MVLKSLLKIFRGFGSNPPALRPILEKKSIQLIDIIPFPPSQSLTKFHPPKIGLISYSVELRQNPPPPGFSSSCAGGVLLNLLISPFFEVFVWK